MEFSFPGLDTKTLTTQHQSTFTIDSVLIDGKKQYDLKLACQNGAGLESELGNIQFNVDYTQTGFILAGSLAPSGYLTQTSAVLELQTSHSANCELRENAGNFTAFENGQGETYHSHPLANLAEGEHLFLIQCHVGEHNLETQISFTVDTTPPQVTNIEDGNLSCGEPLTAFINTNEDNISVYEYQIIDLGVDNTLVVPNQNQENAEPQERVLDNPNPFFRPRPQRTPLRPTFQATQNLLVANGSLAPASPLKFPVENLNASHRFQVNIRAGDAAGNFQPTFVQSNGVTYVAKDHPICVSDKSAPTVSISKNESCTNVQATLSCEDNTACASIKYGVSSKSADCLTNLTYTGQRLTFAKTNHLCFLATDVNGNNASGKYKISFDDKDGDGIKDDCDNCTSTKANKPSDIQGCAADQEPPRIQSSDNDADQLPNFWEDSHNAVGCELDSDSGDSNDNGILDNLEDYDDDGLNNFIEFSRGTDPCVADITPDAVVEDDFDLDDLFGSAPSEESDESSDQQDSPFAQAPSSPDEPSSKLLALILLLLGFVMTAGGIAYLVFYYKQNPSQNKPAQARSSAPSSTSTQSQASPGIFGQIKNSISNMRAQREQKKKLRQRESVFGSFNKSSSSIPHVDKALSSNKPHLPRLHDLAHNYNNNKQQIKPHLKPHERGIFNELEKIAGKTQNKPIEKVVTKEKAKDIFSKLRSISNKRKQK